MSPDTLPTLDDFDFHTRLADQPGVALVMFTRPACSACRHWAQLLAEWHRQHPEHAVYEVDVEQNMALAREFDIFHLPSLHLYVDGEYHAELQSEARLPKLQAAIATALSAGPREAP